MSNACLSSIAFSCLFWFGSLAVRCRVLVAATATATATAAAGALSCAHRASDPAVRACKFLSRLRAAVVGQDPGEKRSSSPLEHVSEMIVPMQTNARTDSRVAGLSR